MIEQRSAPGEPHFHHVRRTPVGVVRELVRESWSIQAARCRTAVERALPDGCVEIYINLDRAGRHPFDGQRHATLRPRAAWIVGPHASSLLIEKEIADCDIVGARLELGAASAILGVPAGELTGALVDLDAVWGATVGVLRERLAELPRPHLRIALVERTLMERARRARRAPETDVVAAMADALSTRACTTIGQLARAFGLSHRRTIDLFDRGVGLKPKALHRVQRLRKVLRAIHAETRPSWTQVAHDSGYYDQAHLINDFYTLAGISPSEYDARRSSVGRGFARHLGADEG
jgi:AraC-like DNA-binding protein